MKKNILLLFMVMTTLIVKSQHCTDIEELFRKRHKIANMTYGHPYTTFDRHNNISIEQNIQNIKNRIIKEQFDTNDKIKPVFQAYKVVYDSANTVYVPTDNGMEANKTVSPLAIYAKNCAFVFLIGLDGNGNTIDIPYRNAFKEKQTYKQQI